MTKKCIIKKGSQPIELQAFISSPDWIRTNDQVINSHLLYR